MSINVTEPAMLLTVDRLRKDDIERARCTPAAERARQAFEMADLGIALERAKLRAADRTASEEEIGRRLSAWLAEPR